MLACLFFAALYFTPGECPPNPIRVQESGDIVLQCDTTTGKNLENMSVDLKRYNNTSQQFEELVIKRYGRTILNNNRVTFNLDDLKSGVVTANISSATLSDSGLYQIGIPAFKKFCNFNVSVHPRRKEGKDLKIRDPTSSSSPNQASASPGGGDEGNTSAIVGSSVGIAIAFIIFIFIFIKRKEICTFLKKTFHGQQQEDPVEMSPTGEPLNPQSAGERRSSCDPAAAEQLLDPDMTTSSSSVNS